MRKADNEVLLTVMSDLDRKQGDYAVPVAYYVSGFSLPMKPVRAILRDLVTECKNKDIWVKVIAFDCEFLELAVEDDHGNDTLQVTEGSVERTYVLDTQHILRYTSCFSDHLSVWLYILSIMMY